MEGAHRINDTAGAPGKGAPVLSSARPLSPRQLRVLQALFEGPKTREQVDRAAGASNGPDVVAKLRRRFALTIPCAFSPVVDRDGRTIERGIYSLTAADRLKIEAFVLAQARIAI